jgi:hypothetical protein
VTKKHRKKERKKRKEERKEGRNELYQNDKLYNSRIYTRE